MARNKLIAEQAQAQAQEQTQAQAQTQAQTQAEQNDELFRTYYNRCAKMTLEKALDVAVTAGTFTAAALSVSMDKSLNDFFESKSLSKVNYVLSLLGKYGRRAPIMAGTFAREFISRAQAIEEGIENEEVVLYPHEDGDVLEYKNGMIHFNSEWERKHTYGNKFESEGEKWDYYFAAAKNIHGSLKGTRIGWLKAHKRSKSAFEEIEKALKALQQKGAKLNKQGVLSKAEVAMLEHIVATAVAAGHLTGI